MNITKFLKQALFPAPTNSGRYFGFHDRGEDWPGQWQQNTPRRDDADILAFPYVWSAVTLIAGDCGKLPLKLIQRGSDGLWSETETAAFSGLLRKPTKHQTRQQWTEGVLLSVLLHGNAYLLKLFDKRGVVRELRTLDPARVRVLVSESGDPYYDLSTDNIAGIGSDQVTVPASSIVHFRVNCLWHPFVGVSPLRSAAMAAGLGLSIHENATDFFRNASRVGGIITAAGSISDEAAASIRDNWQKRYSGRDNANATALLADGLTYQPVPSVPAADAQAIETLGWTGREIAAVFKIPPFKLGLADIKYDQVESLSTIYYSDCLQVYLEHFEALLTEGLNLPSHLAVEFNLDGLLRMNFGAQVESLSAAISGGLLTVNEARRAMNKPAVPGGSVIFRQEQEWPLEQLANRRQGPGDNDNAPGETAKVMNLLRNIKDLAA